MKIILRSYSGADYGPESLTALISAIFGDFMTIFGIYVWRKCMRKWHPKSEAVATYFACRRHPPETGFTIRYAKWSALEKSVAARAVNNYGPESAPEYDRSRHLTFLRGDPGSGSFQVDPLELAPVMEFASFCGVAEACKHCKALLHINFLINLV